ncbi:MAG: 4-hydroxybenzoate octaprenyltransferase, partial [Pseudomonadota bacterium]|nr:4-hydroxybenzoate octaprenyltransferase [Pseudomonadota bacterium]
AINATWPYYAAIAFSALLCVRQYQLIKRRQREGCFTAFLENHYVGLAITIGTALHFYLV